MKYLMLLILLNTTTVMLAQKNQYPEIDIPYKKFVLNNGLTLIVHEDHKMPIAAFSVWYHVGSKNEKPGKTGFAHLFEHIMFTNTEHWDNFDLLMQSVGGSDNNGSTDNDRTNYIETFTKAGLDRVLWAEADRMGFLLNGLDSVKVNVQRGVVQNEKRQRENEPYAIAEELTAKNTYPANHPYSWTVIGSMDDLNAASLDDVKEWFRTYYGPNNATVCISGDVNPDEVFEKVKKYFSDIPASPPISKHSEWIAKMSGTHFQIAQDRVPQARLQKTWNTPGWGTKDLTYLDLLCNILTHGKSSRLYKRLVYDEQLASSVNAFVENREIGGQFFIIADAKPGVELQKINAIVNEELQKIFDHGLTEKELERAKTDYFVNFIRDMEYIGGFSGKNDILAQCQTFGGSPDYYKTIQNRIKAATPLDIKNSALQWLSDGEYVLNIEPYGTFSNTTSALNRAELPPSGSPPIAHFPDIKEFTLSNGIKVFLAELHSVPAININTVMNAGFSADQLSIPGLAVLSGTMMKEGTETKTSTQISDILADLGTTIDIGSNLDFTEVNMRSLKTNFDASLDLYAELLLHPSFPQKDFERVQKIQILNIKQEKSEPRQLGYRILPVLIYGGGHPYSNSFTGSGTEESVSKIKRDDLVKFHQTWFAPNNASVVVVGDISETMLKQKLEDKLATWKAHDVPAKNMNEVAFAEKPKFYIIHKPDAEQSVIFATKTGPAGSDEDFEATKLMNNILGGTFLSRLNMNLREDKHWSYGAFSKMIQTKGPGAFIAFTSVQTDKTRESILEIQKEFIQINAKKQIDPDEFKKEQTSTILSLPMHWENIEGIMDFLVKTIEFSKDKDYAKNYAAMLQNLTLINIQKAAAKVIKPEQLTWLIIGDRTKIEAGIKALNMGVVTFLDEDGKEIK